MTLSDLASLGSFISGHRHRRFREQVGPRQRYLSGPDLWGLPKPKDSSMRKTLATTFATLVLLTGVSSFLSACNTVEGAGKDVSKAGQAVSEEAKEHK